MPSLPLLPLLLATGFAIQPPGEFHGDEPIARNGERWLSLRVEGNHATLQPERLQVTSVEDPIKDQPGQRTGLKVSAGNDDNVVVFLRGDGLRDGAIDSATVAPAQDTPETLPRYAISFNGRAYRIDTECTPQPRQDDVEQEQFRCVLTLHGDGEADILAEVPGYAASGSQRVSLGDEGGVTLLFAGDLDRDGRLDLILDISEHYNVSRPTLFLSSGLRGHGLLQVQARYESTGC